jgi:hypothetical protein
MDSFKASEELVAWHATILMKVCFPILERRNVSGPEQA